MSLYHVKDFSWEFHLQFGGKKGIWPPFGFKIKNSLKNQFCHFQIKMIYILGICLKMSL